MDLSCKETLPATDDVQRPNDPAIAAAAGREIDGRGPPLPFSISAIGLSSSSNQSSSAAGTGSTSLTASPQSQAGPIMRSVVLPAARPPPMRQQTQPLLPARNASGLFNEPFLQQRSLAGPGGNHNNARMPQSRQNNHRAHNVLPNTQLQQLWAHHQQLSGHHASQSQGAFRMTAYNKNPVGTSNMDQSNLLMGRLAQNSHAFIQQQHMNQLLHMTNTANMQQAMPTYQRAQSTGPMNSIVTPTKQHTSGSSTPGPSPRPSILRKRTAGGTQGDSPIGHAVRKLLVTDPVPAATSFLPPASDRDTNTGLCSQSVLPQTSTSNSTAREGLCASPVESEGRSSPSQSSLSTVSTLDEANLLGAQQELSPRKRARKQQFEGVLEAEQQQQLQRDLIKQNQKNKQLQQQQSQTNKLTYKKRKLTQMGRPPNVPKTIRKQTGSSTKTDAPRMTVESALSKGKPNKKECLDEAVKNEGCSDRSIASSRSTSAMSAHDVEQPITIQQGTVSSQSASSKKRAVRDSSLSPCIECRPVPSDWADKYMRTGGHKSNEQLLRELLALETPPINMTECEGGGDGEGTKGVVEKGQGQPEYRPRPRLLAQYNLDWTPRRNHFKRPEMVIVRKSGAAGKLSASQQNRSATNGSQSACVRLANDRRLSRRLSSWKINRLNNQLDQVVEHETMNKEEIDVFLKQLDDLNCTQESTELVQGVQELALCVRQRALAINEQLGETALMIRHICDTHAQEVPTRLAKYSSKRGFRKYNAE